MSNTYSRRETEYKAKQEHKGINPRSTEYAVKRVVSFVSYRSLDLEPETPDLRRYKDSYRYTEEILC